MIYGNDIILDNISMHMHCNEITMVIGKNGAGKTTLIKTLLGDVPYTGKIRFSSKHKNSNVLTIGYVPQSLDIEETPLSVYDLVCSYTSNVPVFMGKNKERFEKIKTHLKEFNVDGLIDKRASSLSGGELQRVLIAIATLPYPELLILDEAASGIDVNGKRDFYELLKHISKKHDISILLISHDFEYIREYATKVILLNKKVLKFGTPEEVLSSKEFSQEFRLGGIV